MSTRYKVGERYRGNSYWWDDRDKKVYVLTEKDEWQEKILCSGARWELFRSGMTWSVPIEKAKEQKKLTVKHSDER